MTSLSFNFGFFASKVVSKYVSIGLEYPILDYKISDIGIDIGYPILDYKISDIGTALIAIKSSNHICVSKCIFPSLLTSYLTINLTGHNCSVLFCVIR